MIRWVVLATIIVVGVVMIAAALEGRFSLGDIKLASVPGSAAPKAIDERSSNAPSGRPFVGVAPWALSAVPDCLEQKLVSRGPLSYVRAHVASGAVAVPDGAALRYGACTIMVHGDTVDVARGRDRFHIPPVSRLYRSSDRLFLLRVDASGAQLRSYAAAKIF